MLTRVKFFIVYCVVFLLTACAAKSASDTEIGDNKKTTKIAKINAQLGIAYLERNEISLAKQKLLLAMAQGPTMPETWYSMAYFYEATGDKEKAGQYYQHAISLEPVRGESHNNYGTFLCHEGHYQGAIQQFLIAVKDSNYLSPADAYENAGLCALKASDDAKAEQFFKQAIMQDPNREISLIKLAELRFKHKNYSAAKANLRQFLAVSDPTKESLALSAKLAKKDA